MKMGSKIMLGCAALFGAALAAGGVYSKMQENSSVTVIGGADGPTAIFIAGKLGGGMVSGLIAVGAVLLICAVGLLILYFHRKKKQL